MSNQEAISIMNVIVHMLEPQYDTDRIEDAVDMAITALELMDTIIDRPCSACRYHKENGCCKWNCVFDGHIGKKVSE